MPAVLMGNKCDLEDERQVTTEEGRSLARVRIANLLSSSHNDQELGVPFFETSALSNTNVTEAIFELVRNIPRNDLVYKLVVVVRAFFFFCSAR